MSQEVKVFTLEEAVNSRYSNDAIKKNFYDKKRKSKKEKGNLGTNQVTQVIKNMETEWDEVKIDKKGGADRKITCIGRKESTARREDGRISNGSWKIPYTQNMDIMIVSVLEQGLVTETAQSLSKWALDFTILTSNEYELIKSRYNEHLKKNHLQVLKDKKYIYEGEERILDDFTHLVKGITNQLAGTLNRMKKAEIIEYYPIYKGHVSDTNEIINLHEDTVKQILTLKRNLMEQYQVNDWYIHTFKNASKTKEYNQAWSVGLEQIMDVKGTPLGLDYYYKVYAIILKAKKEKIIRYLEKYNKEAIREFKKNEVSFLNDNEITYQKERYDFVVKEAKKKEEQFLSEKTKSIILDENMQELYGEETQIKRYYNERDNFIYDEGYYALYFDRLYADRIKRLQEYYGYTFR